MKRLALFITTLSFFLPSVPFREAFAEAERSAADFLRMGDEAYRVGKYLAAVEFYRSALKKNEGDFTARLKLIELLARLEGREDEARREIDAALAMESLSPEQVRSIAEISAANGFHDKAKGAYEALLKREPQDLSALVKVIEVLRSAEDLEWTRQRIEAYEAAPSSTVEGLERVAAKCAQRSHWVLAVEVYGEILRRDEKNLTALLGIGECLKRIGKLWEAARNLTQAVEFYPERAEPSIALWELFLRMGEYVAAEIAFHEAWGKNPECVEAADGYGRVLFSTGRYAEARETLSEALKAMPDSQALLVSLGRVLNYVGEYEEAQKRFRKALEVKPGYPDAILGLGMSYRETGKTELAKEQFFKLYDFWDARAAEPHLVEARDMVDVAIACALTDNPQDALDVLEQALKKDPTDTEALLWEARLFAERHQPTDAMRELQKLLGINPNHPEARAEVAAIAIEAGQYDVAAETCERALKTNPNLIRALDLLSSIQLLDFEYAKAEETVRKALAVNPRSLSSLSFLASCYWQEGKRDAYEEVRKKVFGINPGYSEFYWIVARACESKRQNEDAMTLLKDAVAINPDYAPAYVMIGILLMREGEEEEAETYLRKSYQLDSYNPKTTNFINLLDHMNRDFVSTRTEHFLFRWDGEKDAALGFFLPGYAEEVYREVCREFGFEPKNPTLVEIFDSHDLFSARIVGLPYVATVGASLGKVVAADSPRSALFDWRDVLRHEFVHVVNLQQSKMQIPFWLTEGLATRHEESPLPAAWDEFVARMLYLGRIIPLEELNSHFTRPKTPAHKQAAYAEANLICRFLSERYGEQAIRKMMETYGENLPTAEVIRRCLSKTEEESEREIEEYIFARARERMVDPVFLPGDDELVAEGLKKRPDDAFLKVARARLIFQRSQALPEREREARVDEAVKALEELLDDERGALSAFLALAEIHLALGEYDEAKNTAIQAMAIGGGDFAAHRRLGIAHQMTGDDEEAIKELEMAARLDPRAPDVWYRLGEIYSKRKEEQNTIRALEGEALADRRNVQTSKKLVGIYLSRKEYGKAINVLERVLEYNLYDVGIYRLLVDANRGMGDEKEAARYAEIGAEAACAMAKSLMMLRKDEAVELLKAALELNPKHERAKKLLGQLEKESSPRMPPDDGG
jgi:tetratricopeptide (TPR) repeat protein